MLLASVLAAVLHVTAAQLHFGGLDQGLTKV